MPLPFNNATDLSASFYGDNIDNDLINKNQQMKIKMKQKKNEINEEEEEEETQQMKQSKENEQAKHLNE